MRYKEGDLKNFTKFLQNFKNTFFYRISPVDASQTRQIA